MNFFHTVQVHSKMLIDYYGIEYIYTKSPKIVLDDKIDIKKKKKNVRYNDSLRTFLRVFKTYLWVYHEQYQKINKTDQNARNKFVELARYFMGVKSINNFSGKRICDDESVVWKVSRYSLASLHPYSPYIFMFFFFFSGYTFRCYFSPANWRRAHPQCRMINNAIKHGFVRLSRGSWFLSGTKNILASVHLP